jgi:hypothetical protein
LRLFSSPKHGNAFLWNLVSSTDYQCKINQCVDVIIAIR